MILWDSSRYGKLGFDGRVSGDFFKVNGVEFDLDDLRELEYQRAKRLFPHNPAYHMRPLFKTQKLTLEEFISL